MSITATVENNTIKLPPGVHLPDGTPVRVEPLDAEPTSTFAQRYAAFVGAVKDAPSDLAANHDHYLYGAPKRDA
jgi:hypothetical protein